MEDEDIQKRCRVKHEILATERSYVADLKTAVTVFERPLRENAAQSKSPVVTDNECSAVFSNLQAVVLLNEQLLQALEDEKANSENEGLVGTIGQIFVEIAPYLKMYTLYVNNHAVASETHFALLEKNAKKDAMSPYAAFLKECADKHPESVRGRQLSDILIMPIQRVPRYRLLLEELLKRSPPGDEYELLEKGLGKISAVATLVNERLRDYENRNMVLQIQKQFGNAAQLIAPHRKFILQGILQKQCRKGPKEYIFALFSDTIVYGVRSMVVGATNTVDGVRSLVAGSTASIDDNNPLVEIPVTFKRQIDLNTAKVESMSDLSFQVASPTKSFVVIAGDAISKDLWFHQISNSIASCTARLAETTATEEKEGSIGSVDKSSGGFIFKGWAPLWVPDKEAPTCQLADCNAKFTMLSRRHHCRSCGRVVCDKCSPHRWFLPNIHKTKSQRICDACYLDIRQKFEDEDYSTAGSENAPRPAAPLSSSLMSAAVIQSSVAKSGGAFLSKFASSSSKPASPPPSEEAVAQVGVTTGRKPPPPPRRPISNSPSSSPVSLISARQVPPPPIPLTSANLPTAQVDDASLNLPKNWRALKDESGKPYFWNVVTDAVVIEKPINKTMAVDKKFKLPNVEKSSSHLSPLMSRTPLNYTSSPMMNDCKTPTLSPATSSSSPDVPLAVSPAVSVRGILAGGTFKPPPPPRRENSVKGSSPANTTSPPAARPTVVNRAVADVASRLAQTNHPPSSPVVTHSGKAPSPALVNAGRPMSRMGKRRTSMEGMPTFAERLAALNDAGKFGNSDKVRFSSSRRIAPVNAIPPAPSSTLPKPESPQITNAKTSSPKPPSPKVPNPVQSSPKQPSPKQPSPKQPSPQVASDERVINGVAIGSSPAASSKRLSKPALPARRPLSGTGASFGLKPTNQTFDSPITSVTKMPENASSRMRDISKANDVDFVRIMGMSRLEYEKSPAWKKIDLQRAKGVF